METIGGEASFQDASPLGILLLSLLLFSELSLLFFVLKELLNYREQDLWVSTSWSGMPVP